MLLKRHYAIPDGWAPQRDSRGNLLNAPPLSHIEVKHTGNNPEQNFSERFVKQGIDLGFISILKNMLILHGKPEDLKYKIVRTPGHYCCHCGKALEDANQVISDGLTVGKKHVSEHHPDAAPDKQNPAGYERINHFHCVLAANQHEQFRAKKGAQ